VHSRRKESAAIVCYNVQCKVAWKKKNRAKQKETGREKERERERVRGIKKIQRELR